MIKGAMDRSSVGTLVERTTLMVVLAKMPDGTAQPALDGFSEALSAIPPGLRKTFTYDQGREMSKHTQLTERTGVSVYFCDPLRFYPLGEITGELTTVPGAISSVA
jgi:IS30 family transposase